MGLKGPVCETHPAPVGLARVPLSSRAGDGWYLVSLLAGPGVPGLPVRQGCTRGEGWSSQGAGRTGALRAWLLTLQPLRVAVQL